MFKCDRLTVKLDGDVSYFFMLLLAAVCVYIYIYTQNFMNNACVQITVPWNTEKDLLTTLSSCCNSMRAGMQQKEKREGEQEGWGERDCEWH